MDSWAWFLWGAGALTGIGGLWLLAWALWGDRAKGRRRCPGRLWRGCWYDMSGVTGLRCPECGRAATHERGLRRTRRRWGWAGGGLVLALSGAAGVVAPLLTDGRWKPLVPDTVLIELYGRVDRAWVKEELERRIVGVAHGRSVHRFDAFWMWQWDRLSGRAAEVMLAPKARGAMRRDAAGFLLLHSPFPEREIEALLLAINDPDAGLREVVMWGMKACRYELAPHRERIIAAMAPLVGNPDRWGRDDVETCIRAFQTVLPEEPPPLRSPKRGRCLSPDEVIFRVAGEQSHHLVPVFRELGIWPRGLLWPYDHESGPYRVHRHDLELDGHPGVDCAVQISDVFRIHTELLLFTRSGSGWTFAGLINQSNNTTTPATLWVEADDLGPVLISRQGSGNGGQWWDFRFRVHEDHVELLSQGLTSR